jgi:hypothetical protein
MTMTLFPQIDLGNTTAETGRPEPVPAGLYEVMITNPEIVQNDEKGYIQFKYRAQIVSGEHEGRIIFDSIMLSYPAYPDMVASHQKILKGLMDAVGGPTKLATADDLYNAVNDKICMAKIYVRKDKTGQYGDSNRVSHFLGTGSSVPARTPAPAQAPTRPAPAPAAAPVATPAPAASGGSMPWRK